MRVMWVLWVSCTQYITRTQARACDGKSSQTNPQNQHNPHVRRGAGRAGVPPYGYEKHRRNHDEKLLMEGKCDA
jgi:hypothetical protein